MLELKTGLRKDYLSLRRLYLNSARRLTEEPAGKSVSEDDVQPSSPCWGRQMRTPLLPRSPPEIQTKICELYGVLCSAWGQGSVRWAVKLLLSKGNARTACFTKHCSTANNIPTSVGLWLCQCGDRGPSSSHDEPWQLSCRACGIQSGSAHVVPVSMNQHAEVQRSKARQRRMQEVRKSVRREFKCANSRLETTWSQSRDAVVLNS